MRTGVGYVIFYSLLIRVVCFYFSCRFAHTPLFRFGASMCKANVIFFLFIIFLRYELANEAQAEAVVPAVGRVVGADSHTTVPRVVVPTTPTKHAVRAR